MPILIYDGECNMCSGFIRFIVKTNRNRALKITDFNSEWTSENFIQDPNIDSMVFIEKNKTHIYSNAVIHLMISNNFIFKPLILLKIIPRTFRDSIYKFIAKNRKKIITKQICPIVIPKKNNIFLP